MSDIKKLIESMDRIEECGMDEGGMPASLPAPEMDRGNPVTLNVSMNASGKEHVEDLLDMMKNAGLGDAKPAADAMLPMRMDMERLRGMMDEPEKDGKLDLDMDGDHQPDLDTEEVEEEGYDNEPDPEYQDHEYMTKDLSGGLNREKKAYAAAQDGDNAMAVEEIKAKLMAALQEKKKPDEDGDGVPDWADKKPGQDDNADKKKGGKPKKGVVPPQFKKK